MRRIKVEYRGLILDIDSEYAIALSHMGVDLNESYFDSLVRYSADFYIQRSGMSDMSDINYLMMCDVYYRSHMFSDCYGWIVRYDVDGNILDVFRSYEDIARLFVTHEGLHLYGFDVCDTCVIPIRNGVEFFGKSLKPMFDQKSYKLIVQSWLNGYIRRVCQDFKFSEYVQIGILMNRAFVFWYELLQCVRKSKALIRGRLSLPRVDFDAALDCLFERHKNFMQVFDLNAVEIRNGVYILIFDELCGAYIGQSRVGISKRICQHFTAPSSNFDIQFGCLDVSRIYVMECDLNMLDKFEQDCIACLGREFVLNSLAGGSGIPGSDTNMFLSDKSYSELDHLSAIGPCRE